MSAPLRALFVVLVFTFFNSPRQARAVVNLQADVFTMEFDASTPQHMAQRPDDWPAWMQGVAEEGGRFLSDPGCWDLPAATPRGVGRFSVDVDRLLVLDDLAITLVYEESEDADFVVQLYDAAGQVVALDLFSNIISAGQQARTDTFVIPLSKYPSVSRVSLRRLEGHVQIYGFVLVPVMGEVKATLDEEAYLSTLFGDMLHPEHPLMLEAKRIAEKRDLALNLEERAIYALKPLEQINEVGERALSEADYPAFEPAGLDVQGDVTFYRSGTTFDFIRNCYRALQLYYPNLTCKFTNTDSQDVADALLGGKAGFGVMSRALSLAERERFFQKHGYALIEIPIAVDALQVVVHPTNPIEKMSLPQLDAIFSKTRKAGFPDDIQTWGDAGLSGTWAGASIALHGGRPEFGTSKTFQRLVMDGGEWKDGLTSADVVFAVPEAVSKSQFAIGFATSRPRGGSVKLLALAKNRGEPHYVPDADAIYGKTYPLTRYFYMYIDAKRPSDLSPFLQEYLSLLLSLQGQEIIAKVGVLPLGLQDVLRARHTAGLP